MGMKAEDVLGFTIGYVEKTLQGAGGLKGDKGEKGDPGTTYTPVIGTVRTVDSLTDASASVVTNDVTKKATFNFNIPKGTNGVGGVSPSVEIVPTATGNTVKITDANGVKNFEVLNGKDAEKRIYTTLEELGLTAPVSVGEIFNAMPNKTMAVLACEAKDKNEGTVNISDLPASFGVLTIKKSGVGRFSIDYQNSFFSSPCDVKRWIGTLKGSDGTGLTWKQLSAEPTFVTLSDIGLTADATFQDVISALPKGGSALLGVTEFTNYQTIFPYEEGNDQFARVYIVKGAADGSSMYARWFRKDGVKEAIAKFNINDNKLAGWNEYTSRSYVDNKIAEVKTGLSNNLGELDTKTTSTIVKTNSNLLYIGAKQLGMLPMDKFYLFKITAFCEDGYNISLAKYKHDESISVKTISNSKTTIDSSNKVGTIKYSGALKCAYVEYIGVADESVDFGGWKDATELATIDKLGGLTFSASGTTLSITDGTNTWTLEANS